MSSNNPAMGSGKFISFTVSVIIMVALSMQFGIFWIFLGLILLSPVLFILGFAMSFIIPDELQRRRERKEKINMMKRHGMSNEEIKKVIRLEDEEKERQWKKVLDEKRIREEEKKKGIERRKKKLEDKKLKEELEAIREIREKLRK